MAWEWLVLVALAVAAAAYIAMPRRGPTDVPDDAVERLQAERETLLAALRELDDDAASGRISPDDRIEGRRALGPRLREVTEALAALGHRRNLAPRETNEKTTPLDASSSDAAGDTVDHPSLADASTVGAGDEERA